MEFLTEYGMFLAKLGTVTVLLVLVLIAVVMLVARARAGSGEHLEVKNLNERYESMAVAIKAAMLPKNQFKQTLKALKQRRKAAAKSAGASADTRRQRIFVLDFKGDLRASAVASLREEVSAVLRVAEPRDEILVTLESAGGTVHGYGLGASQLRRIRDRGIRLTVAVDKVAASGGYMMACVADRIIAAPFAILGSIGVLAQLPNFHRLLKKHDIDFEQIAAGEYKRTLTLFGENTEQDRRKLEQEIHDTHKLFKEFVRTNRPQLDVEAIATGEHWYGTRALALKLVDELRTSDDYLLARADDADLYAVKFARRRAPLERLFSSVRAAVDGLSPAPG